VLEREASLLGWCIKGCDKVGREVHIAAANSPDEQCCHRCGKESTLTTEGKHARLSTATPYLCVCIELQQYCQAGRQLSCQEHQGSCGGDSACC